MMTFSEKLKQAMQELHLNQRQVCGMTGKSKGSVSQYLSGKQIPSEDVQRDIAVALGLESDYFSKLDEQVKVLPTKELRDSVIPRLEVEKAAKLLQMNHNTVRKGLQQGVFLGAMAFIHQITGGFTSSTQDVLQRSKVLQFSEV